MAGCEPMGSPSVVGTGYSAGLSGVCKVNHKVHECHQNRVNSTFAAREALVEACVDAEAERLLEHVHAAFGRAVDASPQRRVAEGFLGVFRYARESPAGLAILFDSGHAASRAAVRRVEDRMRDLLRREARAGGRELPDADLLAAALLGAAAAVAPRLEGRDAEAVAIALASAVRD
jgi:hypothetical protein